VKRKPIADERLLADIKLMAAVGLECHLSNLVREIIGGAHHLLGEFQQMIQYATSETRLRLIDKLQAIRKEECRG
jgi:hypothetical protein